MHANGQESLLLAIKDEHTAKHSALTAACFAACDEDEVLSYILNIPNSPPPDLIQ
jgi:hypothetical protein